MEIVARYHGTQEANGHGGIRTCQGQKLPDDIPTMTITLEEEVFRACAEAESKRGNLAASDNEKYRAFEEYERAIRLIKQAA